VDIAVNAVIFDTTDRVLLTKRRDIPMWCLPGGRLEPGETLTQAVRREVREEVGIEVSVIRLTGIYSVGNIRVIYPASGHVVVVAFECRIVSGTPGLSDEVAEIGYFPSASLPIEIIETHPQRINDALARLPYAVYDP
jgi:ADP-ribose pyrophosphatase YjhB (NUDIX family)